MDRIMSNLRNKCEGHGLINRPPTSPYLHDCWWRNEPPTTLKEAKPKKEGVSSETEASPLPAKSDSTFPSLHVYLRHDLPMSTSPLHSRGRG